MCRANETHGIISWHTFLGDGLALPEVSFQNYFTHEAAHILNQHHPNECDAPNNWASIVQSPGPTPHLHFPDVEFINDTYGPRSVAAKLMWGPDALSWSVTGTTAPTNTSGALGRFAATNSRSGSHMFAGFIESGSLRRFHVSRYTGSLWEHRSSVITSDSHSHPGIASASNSDDLIAYPSVYALSTGIHQVRFRISSNAGSSWGSETELSAAGSRTNHPGVSATYDPRRGRYIVIWRQSAGYNSTTGHHGSYIRYRTVPSGANREIDGWYAADTPSIACGEEEVVGEYNCLLAWTNALSWSRTVVWTQCKLEGDPHFNTLDCLPPKTHGYAAVGSPSVAYSSTGDYPWHIALNQGHAGTYTWRKGPSWSDNFQDQRSFWHYPQSLLPASGSRVGMRVVLTGND